MKTRDKLILGTLAGAGLAFGARELLRARRRISLDGRVVIITGASAGHGLVAARYAADRGAKLVIAARNPDDLSAAQADLAQGGARDVLAVPTDVSDRDQCQRLIDRAIERHGRIDVLVNNAGIIQVGPMETFALEDFEEAMATNFYGTLNCSLAVIPHMKQRGFGRIVVVNSVGGKIAVPHLMPYVSSKFALSGLTKSLRVELAKDGILVTGVYPATMRTGGHTHAWIKGDRQAEYSLFALSDSIPGLATSAEHAAKVMWKAACDGDAEVNVGLLSRFGATLEALMPNWGAEATALIAGMLPRATGPGPAVQGGQVGGAFPALLSGVIPPRTRPTG